MPDQKQTGHRGNCEYYGPINGAAKPSSPGSDFIAWVWSRHHRSINRQYGFNASP
jgi:hypothetical protein